MRRHSLSLCLFAAVLSGCTAALTALAVESFDPLKAKLTQIAAEPFSGKPDEYKAYSKNLGEALVLAAERVSLNSKTICINKLQHFLFFERISSLN